MIALSMVLRSHPMSLGGVFMMLSCLVMRVFCHVDLLWSRYFDSLNPMQVMNHSSSHPLRPGSITPALPANFPRTRDIIAQHGSGVVTRGMLLPRRGVQCNFCLPAAGSARALVGARV